MEGQKNKEIDLVKELGLRSGYHDLEINGKKYILREPSAMEQIGIEDNSLDVNGSIDIFTYIKDITKFVSPKIEIKDMVERVTDEIVLDNCILTFKELSIENAFKIILKGLKVGKNSNGELVMKPNQQESIMNIIKNSDNKDMIDINKLTRRELKKIFEEFQQIYNVEGAMKLYDTFQEFVQD